MIPVIVKAEPATFDELVRTPGKEFLERCPNPTTAQWNQNNFWTRVAKEFYEAYGRVCAFSCHFISLGDHTTDHFLSKNDHPDKAYEWSNYRLADWYINRKKQKQAVMDPFEVQSEWFVIDFPSLLVKPNENIEGDLKEKIESTITALGLNDEDNCMYNRSLYVEDYCKERTNFSHLEKNAPFVAVELLRQNLVDDIKNIMKY